MSASVSQLLLVGVLLPGFCPSARSLPGSHLRHPGGRRRSGTPAWREPHGWALRRGSPGRCTRGQHSAVAQVLASGGLAHRAGAPGWGRRRVLSVPMETAPGRLSAPAPAFHSAVQRGGRQPLRARFFGHPREVKPLASGPRIFCSGPHGHSARACLASPRNPWKTLSSAEEGTATPLPHDLENSRSPTIIQKEPQWLWAEPTAIFA